MMLCYSFRPSCIAGKISGFVFLFSGERRKKKGCTGYAADSSGTGPERWCCLSYLAAEQIPDLNVFACLFFLLLLLFLLASALF